MVRADVLVIGSGAAGLLLALRSAAQGHSVALATKGTLAESNTAWAQGGVAAALDLEDDSPAVHFADTIAAGAGLCDDGAAAVVAAEAPQRVEELRQLGVAFDIGLGGRLDLTREAAHSHARVAHAADATGRAISDTLVARALRHPNVTVLESATAIELILDDSCRGAWFAAAGRVVPVLAGATALATGGAGRLFARTTNPPSATADGLDLAIRAGADLADVEFVQFHPTALALPDAPALLVSEAARGEGGQLVDAAGRRFCFDADPRGELAPRDIVARAIFRQLKASREGVWLDLRPIGSPDVIRARFPNIAAACARFGIDIGTTPIPVAPAAHYHMGGVRTDLWARTTVQSLYAVGECACTGLHGANRLASNSLAECLVFAARAAEDIHRSLEPPDDFPMPTVAPVHVEAPATVQSLPDVMWHAAGVERSGVVLESAMLALRTPVIARPVDRAAIEARSMRSAAEILTAAALLRRESRGAHYRSDYPERDDVRWRTRIVWTTAGARLEPVTVAR